MSEQALILYDPAARSISIAAAAEEAKIAALNGCALIGAVKNPEQQQEAVNAVRDVKAVLLAVEKARKTVKEPLLEACRLLDATAAKFVEELKAEELRVNTELGNYQMEVIAEARRKEQERQAELRRIEDERLAEQRRIAEAAAEAERKRLEEVRKAEAAAAAERKRIADEAAAAKSKANKARLERERLEFEARQKREADEREAQRLKDEAARKAEQERQDALAKQAVEAVGPAALPNKAKGQVVKAVWTFDVVDIHLLYKMHPGFVTLTVNRAEINQALSQGVREIKGLRIYEDIQSRTRQSGQKFIEV